MVINTKGLGFMMIESIECENCHRTCDASDSSCRECGFPLVPKILTLKF